MKSKRAMSHHGGSSKPTSHNHTPALHSDNVSITKSLKKERGSSTTPNSKKKVRRNSSRKFSLTMNNLQKFKSQASTEKLESEGKTIEKLRLAENLLAIT